MKFSIIIVTHNRDKKFFECLQSISSQVCSFRYEVITIFNNEYSYFEKARKLFPNFKHLSVAEMSPAAARNFAIKNAIGEYIFFLDDDCTLPLNYLSEKINFTLNWDVLGGPDQTPSISNPLQYLIGEVLQSPFCMGPTYRRHFNAGIYNSNADEDSIILCNLWFKRSLFSGENFYFNEQLFRNEENHLIKELKNSGKHIHYNPKMYVFHHRKDSLPLLAAAVVKSGDCRCRSFFLIPKIKEIIYFLPLIFYSFLLMSIFLPNISLVYGFLFYFVILCFYSIYRFKKIDLLFIFLHFFIIFNYAVGLTKGLMMIFKKKFILTKARKSVTNELET